MFQHRGFYFFCPARPTLVAANKLVKVSPEDALSIGIGGRHGPHRNWPRLFHLSLPRVGPSNRRSGGTGAAGHFMASPACAPVLTVRRLGAQHARTRGLGPGQVSAASQATATLGTDRRVVQLEVVVQRRLVGLRELLTLQLDVWRRANLLFGYRHL